MVIDRSVRRTGFYVDLLNRLLANFSMRSFYCWIPGLMIVLTVQNSPAQSVPVIRYHALKQLLTQPTDSVLVSNFWATWCKPCVEELPYFEQLSLLYANRRVKVVLVSLDGVSQLEKRVRPFLIKRKISSARVLLFDEEKDDTWISRVDPNWSGALPFTVIISPRQQQRKTFEKSFTKAELEAELQPFVH